MHKTHLNGYLVERRKKKVGKERKKNRGRWRKGRKEGWLEL
jgi:hypothetical protein